MRKRGTEQRGFTLVEMAVVLVIVGLLIGLGASMMGPLTRSAKLKHARSDVDNTYNAVIGYALANKQLPASLTALGIKTTDSYDQNLVYYAATNLTTSDLCTATDTYYTVSDEGTTKSGVAFVVLSTGENLCGQSGDGTGNPSFTISNQDVVVSCPADANAKYDDIVKYYDISSLREKVCDRFRVITESLPSGTEGVAYTSTSLEAADGAGSYSWSVTSGSLPTGFPALPGNGVISGTATANGIFSFTVTVTDSESKTATKRLSIKIDPNDPVITTEVLHYSSVGASYSASVAATGGAGSYTWSLLSGSLPPGLSLNSGTGVISGTPTTAGTYSFTLRVTDSGSRTGDKTLSIAINSS